MWTEPDLLLPSTVLQHTCRTYQTIMNSLIVHSRFSDALYVLSSVKLWQCITHCYSYAHLCRYGQRWRRWWQRQLWRKNAEDSDCWWLPRPAREAKAAPSARTSTYCSAIQTLQPFFPPYFFLSYLPCNYIPLGKSVDILHEDVFQFAFYSLPILSTSTFSYSVPYSLTATHLLFIIWPITLL